MNIKTNISNIDIAGTYCYPLVIRYRIERSVAAVRQPANCSAR